MDELLLHLGDENEESTAAEKVARTHCLDHDESMMVALTQQGIFCSWKSISMGKRVQYWP